MLIADNVGIATATESTGILDVSALVGYLPGSIILTANQGSIASLTLLINPQAAAAIPEPAGWILACLAFAGQLCRNRRPPLQQRCGL
jgi:hypothetical protein